MKRYAVYVTPAAETAILQHASFIAQDKVSAASTWLEELWDVIESLEQLPHRHPVSPAESDALGAQVRKLVFGNYLLFYHVNEEQGIVEVLRFRHGARLP